MEGEKTKLFLRALQFQQLIHCYSHEIWRIQITRTPTAGQSYAGRVKQKHRRNVNNGNEKEWKVKFAMNANAIYKFPIEIN